MGLYLRLTYRQFWLFYFFYRFVIYLFTIFVYARLTTLGDTARYLTGHGGLSTDWLLNSTAMMDFFGRYLGSLGFHNMFMSNLPCMICSVFVIRWAIEKTKLRENMPSLLLMAILCLPNFCIWTTVYSKEFIGLVISAIFGVLFVRFFNGDFTLKLRDYMAIYLCLLFKPQYLPFIFQGLFYIYVCKRWVRSVNSMGILAIVVVVINIGVIMALTPLINKLSLMMYAHFDFGGTSTRMNIFVKDGDFFRYMPYGMAIAFWGPTIDEIMKSPLMIMAALESCIMCCLLIWMSSGILRQLFTKGRISPIHFFSTLFTTIGILLVHYPFGIFNPGSAIRYRTNFLFLFIIILSYLYVYKNGEKRTNYCIL